MEKTENLKSSTKNVGSSEKVLLLLEPEAPGEIYVRFIEKTDAKAPEWSVQMQWASPYKNINPEELLWFPMKELSVYYVRKLLYKLLNDDLTFNQFSKANKKRMLEHSDLSRKPITYWGCCLSGEVGEFCNLIKKLEGGKDIPLAEIGKELADVDTYLDICYERLGLDRPTTLKEKFNEVSDRYGAPIKL